LKACDGIGWGDEERKRGTADGPDEMSDQDEQLLDVEGRGRTAWC
jgi:hypothetical protein